MKKISFLIAAVILLGGCVTDQQFAALSEKVSLIESEQNDFGSKIDSVHKAMDSFEKEIEAREKNLRSGYANLIAEKTSLQNRIIELNGEMERIFYRLDSFSSRFETLEKRFTALDQRTSSLENYLDFDKNQDKKIKKENDKTVSDLKKEENKPESEAFVLEKAGEEEIYEQAKKEFDLENFEKAMKFFLYHVKNFPKSSMADNSLFWIGEIHYKKGDYKRAIIEYQNVIEKYPSGNKVPAAYLKQGLAFYNIDSKENARIIFEKLISNFPLSNEALIAKKKLKSF